MRRITTRYIDAIQHHFVKQRVGAPTQGISAFVDGCARCCRMSCMRQLMIGHGFMIRHRRLCGPQYNLPPFRATSTRCRFRAINLDSTTQSIRLPIFWQFLPYKYQGAKLTKHQRQHDALWSIRIETPKTCVGFDR